MRRVDPEDATDPRSLGGVLKIDQVLLRHRLGILGSQESVATAITKPAHCWRVIEPGDHHLAVELLRIFLQPRKSNKRAIGHNWRHGVASDLDAAILLLRLEPLIARGLGQWQLEFSAAVGG